MTDSRTIAAAVARLLWSLWDALGVPSVVREHPHTCVDLEPLILFTPLLARTDARLRELALHWFCQHAEQVSSPRLAALAKRAPAAVREDLIDLLGPTGMLPKSLGVAPTEATRAATRPIQLDLRQPPLVQLRLRALVGPGMRSDVLLQLMLRHPEPLRTRVLTRLGYHKPRLLKVLHSLEQAGFVEVVMEGTAKTFRLVDVDSFRHLLGVAGLSWPDWWSVFVVLVELITFEDNARRTTVGLARLEAHSTRERLAPEVARLGVSLPLPVTARNARAAEDLMEWGMALVVQDLSEPAVGRRF